MLLFAETARLVFTCSNEVVSDVLKVIVRSFGGGFSVRVGSRTQNKLIPSVQWQCMQLLALVVFLVISWGSCVYVIL